MAPPSSVVAVVGSTSGAGGSFFKTAVQLHNPTTATLSGMLVYHPQGVPAGSAGTTGMVIDQVGLDLVLESGDRAVLIAPPESARARFNIGIRTLKGGVAMSVTIRNKAGSVLKTLTKSYGATYFEQKTASDMLGIPFDESDSIVFEVTLGSVVIYGAATDNITQDPSLQFARVIR